VSLAGNIEFYQLLHSGICSSLDCKYFEGSLGKIIAYHKDRKDDKHEVGHYTIKQFLKSGGYNNTFETSDGKVFRTLRLDKNNDPKLIIQLKDNGFGYMISQNSLRELYGLIIQYYFTQTCQTHVCKVFDFGIMKYGEHNIAYAILEKADFDMKQLFDESDITQSKPQLNLETFKKLYKDVNSALQCIHTNGFVHSDIKPANVGIVVEQDGNTIRPILFDFGMAVPKDSERCKSHTFGTPAYTPYNFTAYNCRIQTDLYAYGLMLLKHLFTGTPDVTITTKTLHVKNSWFYDINNVTCDAEPLHMDFSKLFTCSNLKHKKTSVTLLQSTLYENLYKTVDPKLVETDKELVSSKAFIISLLNSVNTQLDATIDYSWFKSSEDSSVENTNLSQSIASAVESALKSKLSRDDSSTGMIQKTDLSKTIAAAVESALKSDSVIADESSYISSSNSTYDSKSNSKKIDVENELKNLSELTMEFFSESSVNESDDTKNTVEFVESVTPLVKSIDSKPISDPKLKQVVNKIITVLRQAKTRKQIADGVVNVAQMISPPSDSSVSGLSVTINTPDQASGFLLVCPSSKQVVGILNIDNSNSENQICSFLYDKDFSTNRTFSRPFLSSDPNVCISEFMNTIDGIINKTIKCYTTPSNSFIKQSPAIVESNTLSSLFANAFIRVITSPTAESLPQSQSSPPPSPYSLSIKSSSESSSPFPVKSSSSSSSSYLQAPSPSAPFNIVPSKTLPLAQVSNKIASKYKQVVRAEDIDKYNFIHVNKIDKNNKDIQYITENGNLLGKLTKYHSQQFFGGEGYIYDFENGKFYFDSVSVTENEVPKVAEYNS
jgi:serine/threonine protein kinase